MPYKTQNKKDYLYRFIIIIFNEENNVVLENIVIQRFLKQGQT